MPEGDSIFRAARTLHRALAGHVVTRFETAYAHLARVDADQPIAGRTVIRCESAGKHLLMFLSGAPDVLKAQDPAHVSQVMSRPSRRLAPPEAGQSDTATSEAEPHDSCSPVRGGASLVLRTHMRMNGSWHLYRHGERWWRAPQTMRIRIDTADWVAVAFDVPVAEFVHEHELERRGPVAALGPDLLAGARRGGSLDPPSDTPVEGASQDAPLQFDRQEAIRRLYACGAMPIQRALLDQRVIAGIGNIFESETLFLAGVHPETPASALGEEGLGKLVDVAQQLLQMNVTKGSGAGITTVRGLRQSTGQAGPDDRLYVYGRAGRPCRRCGTPIMMRKTGADARSTYWCPSCQSDEDRSSDEARTKK